MTPAVQIALGAFLLIGILGVQIVKSIHKLKIKQLEEVTKKENNIQETERLQVMAAVVSKTALPMESEPRKFGATVVETVEPISPTHQLISEEPAKLGTPDFKALEQETSWTSKKGYFHVLAVDCSKDGIINMILQGADDYQFKASYISSESSDDKSSNVDEAVREVLCASLASRTPVFFCLNLEEKGARPAKAVVLDVKSKMPEEAVQSEGDRMIQ